VMGHWLGGYQQQLFLWSAHVDVKQLPLEELLLWHEVRADTGSTSCRGYEWC
jgi:hypothetical protein